jgi:antitoxin ParD1/3/4
MPKRATMNISVPTAVRDYIADRVSEGHYGSVSEYVRELVRQDREERFRDAVDAKLIEALDGGDSREMTPADFARIKAEVRRRAGAKPRRRR